MEFDEKKEIKVTASDALEFEPVVHDSSSGRWTLRAFLLLVLFGVAVISWGLYGDEMIAQFSSNDGNVPLIKAPDGPIKVRPENPGGLKVPNQDKLVYDRIQNDSGVINNSERRIERLLPPPEQPIEKPSFRSAKKEQNSRSKETMGNGSKSKVKEKIVRSKRTALKVFPVFKKVDTCAAEFKSFTPYMYSTYQRNFSLNTECEANPTNKKKIIILGGGPNRIGQGIEFDYCCCQASFALKDNGYETIMINCNPETVSTDYDTSDRLYFEPLIEEYVQNIILKEKSNGNLLGIIAQFGGQTPIKLAKFLYENSLPILGTQYSSIDLAEDRDRFRNLLIKLNLKQAESGIAYTYNQAIKISNKIGLPLVIRPSYVLGGRAMEIVHEKNRLKEFINEAFKVSEENPILIDKFINNAMEIDVDAISDGKDVYVAGIMQHIEEAGIHSGDSACCLPPISIKDNLLKELKIQTRKLALALKVKGFLNIQFAIKKDEIFVIEVNPRASRTVPFVSKANGVPLAKIASRIMAGEKLSKYKLKYQTNKTFAVKEAVFPFNKFPDSDVLLGPEMKSTGEVMGFDDDFGMAYAKSQIAASNSLPTKGLAFLSVKDTHKEEIIDLAKKLLKLNFNLCGTEGTANAIRNKGIKCKKINKVSGGNPHIVDVLNSKKIALVINTGGGKRKHRVSDARALRRATLINKVPYCTNMSTAYACLEAIQSLKNKKLKVKSLQEN